MSKVFEHNAIIPRDDLGHVGDFTYAPTQMNVESSHTCEARAGGERVRNPIPSKGMGFQLGWLLPVC